MENKAFVVFCDKIFTECAAILEAKGPDYSGLQDRLKNFKEVAAKYDVSAEAAVMIYYEKHMQAVSTYIKSGKLTGEPIREKIKDLINYLVLLGAIIEDNETQQKIRPPHPSTRGKIE